jgi:hypothetical protein
MRPSHLVALGIAFVFVGYACIFVSVAVLKIRGETGRGLRNDCAAWAGSGPGMTPKERDMCRNLVLADLLVFAAVPILGTSVALIVLADAQRQKALERIV